MTDTPDLSPEAVDAQAAWYEWFYGQIERNACEGGRYHDAAVTICALSADLATARELITLLEGEQARAEQAEARASALWAALQEVRAVVVCVNHAAERYPLAWAELTGDCPAVIVKGCEDG